MSRRRVGADQARSHAAWASSSSPGVGELAGARPGSSGGGRSRIAAGCGRRRGRRRRRPLPARLPRRRGAWDRTAAERLASARGGRCRTRPGRPATNRPAGAGRPRPGSGTAGRRREQPVEVRHRPLLRVRRQVDEQVAAQDQVVGRSAARNAGSIRLPGGTGRVAGAAGAVPTARPTGGSTPGARSAPASRNENAGYAGAARGQVVARRGRRASMVQRSGGTPARAARWPASTAPRRCCTARSGRGPGGRPRPRGDEPRPARSNSARPPRKNHVSGTTNSSTSASRLVRLGVSTRGVRVGVVEPAGAHPRRDRARAGGRPRATRGRARCGRGRQFRRAARFMAGTPRDQPAGAGRDSCEQPVRVEQSEDAVPVRERRAEARPVRAAGRIGWRVRGRSRGCRRPAWRAARRATPGRRRAREQDDAAAQVRRALAGARSACRSTTGTTRPR